MTQLFTLQTLLPILGTFLIAAFLHLLALKLFPRWGLLDFPERYGLQRARIPYPTGVIAVVTFLAFFCGWIVRDVQDIGLAVAVVVLALFCFRDDRKQLSPLLRLGIQILVALIVFLCGARIYSLTNPLEGILGGPVIPLDTYAIPWETFSDPSMLGAAFTVMWMLLTINALNWFDGIPGQVSLLSAIAFATIGGLAVLRGDGSIAQQELALTAFVLAGIAAAGLLFDFPPARVLMGDTGAMFFGLLLGALTIYAGGKVATAFLVLGVPLLDSLIVGVRRTLRGQSIMRGGRDHLHHRLLDAGWSPRAVILLTAMLGTAFGVTALFLTTTGKIAAAGILALLMLGLHASAKSPGNTGARRKA